MDKIVNQNSLIIAEIGSVHDGSFGNAKRLIDLAKECGADCVKFQTHIAEAETLPDAPMPSFFKGEPRYQYFKRTSFNIDQWKELKQHCDKINIEFLSSPFSIEAIDLLEEVGNQRYKIPSGEVTNIPLIEAVAHTKKPVLLSSGMSSWKELDCAVEAIQKTHNNITILQCTSNYPCDYEDVGLNVMQQIKDRYDLPFGLSDHTLTNYSCFAAICLGASVIEKHLTFSQKMYGSDARHSIEPHMFKDLTEGIKAIRLMLSSKVDKDEMSKKMNEMKHVFQKSIVSKIHIPKDTIITQDMVAFKKPGNGIPASEYLSVVGKVVNKTIDKDTLISKEDLK